jgi:xanthine dehydrogenase accessory factor
VKLDLLTALNTERAARRAAVVVTDMASGVSHLIHGADVAEGTALGEAAHRALRSGKSGLVELEGHRLFLAVHLPPVKLVVVGAVHISQAMVPLAEALGLDLTIVDPRIAFATPERFPSVKLLADWPEDALPALSVDAYTAFVALTHDPKIDDPALSHALRAECFYIGALGSRKTHAGRLARLEAAGFDGATLARIRAPIGLDIGAVSPAEIAVAIVGEIIAAQRKSAP